VTVGKLGLIAWIVFGVMSFAFMPMILLVHSIHGLPGPVAIGLDVFIVAGLWWGSFVYGMYSAQAGMGGGDKRLFKNGVRGTAVVLERQGTNMTIGGQPDMGIMGRQVYRYRLQVTLPGREPYETVVRVAASRVEEGRTVGIVAGRHNHRRVAIDFHRDERGRPTSPVYTDGRDDRRSRDQVRRKEKQDPRTRPAGQSHHFEKDLHPRRHRQPQDAVPHQSGPQDAVPPGFREKSRAAHTTHQGEGERLRLLAEAARLHRDGVLTDDEFAVEKARILGS
jgi:hypothetical protein